MDRSPGFQILGLGLVLVGWGGYEWFRGQFEGPFYGRRGNNDRQRLMHSHDLPDPFAKGPLKSPVTSCRSLL